LIKVDASTDGAGEPRVDSLRRLIARKRSEKRRLEREIQACRAQMAQLDALRRSRLDPINDEVHGHFVFALSHADLPAIAVRAVRQLYITLMSAGTISRRAVPDAVSPDDDEQDDCPCPSCRAGAADAANADPWADHPGDRETRGQRAPSRDPERSASLRDLYRDLAVRYHPDKARDDNTRVEHERLMREINTAYNAGDLDALTALSQELGFSVAGNGVLEALARQYERLKAEIRMLRADPLGQLVVETRRAERYREPTPLHELTRDIEGHVAHLQRLADVFRQFRSGGVGPDEFLRELLGEPPEEADDKDDDEADGDAVDELDMLLAVLSSMLEPEPATARRRPASNRRTKKPRARP
jgi:curved DNA-binding protein CbpA